LVLEFIGTLKFVKLLAPTITTINHANAAVNNLAVIGYAS